MKRKEFLKQACTLGLCSCAVASMFAPLVSGAETETTGAKPEKPNDDWRLGFMQQRYAKLLAALDQRADTGTLDAALEQVGRFCADSAKVAKPYAGKPEGLVKFMREQWQSDVTYDAEAGRVSLAFPAIKECPCPFVRMGVTPARICQCAVGFQKEAFGVAFGRPVEVELKSSLLRGGERCAFEVRASHAA